MTTYASPRLTRRALQILISFIFLFGSFMVIVSIIKIINYVGQHPRHNNDTRVNIQTMKTSHSMTNDETIFDNQYDDDDDTDVYEDMARFPSISSPSVQLMFGLITFGHGVFGIISITKERTSFLLAYSYILLISCFTKLLFIIASLAMYTVSSSQKLLSSVAKLIVLTSMIEIILVMIVCQFSKLIKRGDAARQEIQSIHSYHLERRSRSRSQSRIRSMSGNSPYLVGRPTPISVHSISDSRAVSIEPSMISMNIMSDNDTASYYVPSPIYLKLDR